MEPSKSPKCGYALNFFISDISLISDYILCVDCHLVLRDPVTVPPCNHKYCSPCFNRIKTRAKERNEELCCAVDRNVIDEAKVVEDPILKTAVDNLTVCYYKKSGCQWQGDVSEIDTHQSYCQHKDQANENNEHCHNTSNFLKKMKLRVIKCEELIAEKDIEIKELKFSNGELEGELQRLRVMLEEEKLNNSMIFEGFKNQLRAMKKEIGKNRMELAKVKVEDEEAIIID